MTSDTAFQMMRGHAESEGVPLYLRVASALRARILQGEWRVGDRLPAFEQLAREHGVAMNTIRTAVEVLSSQRLVSTARGLGTRITADSVPLAHPELKAAINDPQSRLSLQHSIAMVTNRVVRSLPAELDAGYAQAQRYQHLDKVHTFHGVPYAVVNAYVEKSVFDRFPKGAAAQQTLIHLMRDHADVDIATSRQELTITHADPRTASQLQYPLAAPLARIRHWRLASDGTVIYASVVSYRSDIFVWDITRRGSDQHAADDEAPVHEPVTARGKPATPTRRRPSKR